MRILLDSNRYTDFARGEATSVDCLQRATRVYVPFVVPALAVQPGLHLFARDRHFDHLPQVPRA